MRWMTIGGGTLPRRKPGTLICRPSVLADWAIRLSSSPGSTDACTRTRDSGSSSVSVLTPLVAMVGEGTSRIRWPGVATRRRLPERAAAWLLTGPVGHLAAGLTDLAALVWVLGRARLRGSGD